MITLKKESTQKKKKSRFALNTLLLSLSFPLLTSCSHKAYIPDVEICAEIPFVDGAEGACATNLSKKSRLINSEDWENQRPHMIMIHSEQWSKIKLSWLKACRAAGSDCETALQSVDSLVKMLDDLASSIKLSK